MNKASLQSDLLAELLQQLRQRDSQVSLEMSPLPPMDELKQHCAVLLSLFAHSGQTSSKGLEAAYHAGAKLAPFDHMPAMPAMDMLNVQAINQTLNLFANTAQGFRLRLFQALAAVVQHDHQITALEQTLLEQVGETLAIPTDAVSDACILPEAVATIEQDLEAIDTAASQVRTDERLQGAAAKIPFTFELTLPVKALIFANLIPLPGVLFFGWDAGALLLLYWLENLVIGGYTLIRMLHNGGLKAVFVSLFFVFHYGMFCAVHGLFVLMLSNTGMEEVESFPGFAQDDSFVLFLPLIMIQGVISTIVERYPGLLFLPLLSFIISHGISIVTHHFIGKEDAGRSADSIMGDPYGRIVILHVAIIAGSFFIIAGKMASVIPILLLLIILKTGLDLYEHQRSHRKRQRNQQTSD